MESLKQYPKEALIYLLALAGERLEEKDRRLPRETIIRHISARDEIKEKIHLLLEEVPIFSDTAFVDCWWAAFPKNRNFCMKTSFGACAYSHDGKIIATSNNRRIGESQGIESPFCNKKDGCVRQRLSSRIDQTIGECDHSIIVLLRKIFDLGYRPQDFAEIKIYEAGFLVDQDLKPWWRMEKNYTCLYYVRIFLTFGLEEVWGVVGESSEARWKPLSVKADYPILAKRALAQIEQK